MMASPDIKTFLVDGGMPKSGRSIATRMLADMYQHGNEFISMSQGMIPETCRVYVWDAANDPETDTGYRLWHEHGRATVHAGRIGTEAGDKAYATIANLALEAAEDGPVRIIIDLPAVQDSRMLVKALKPGLLEKLNTVPVWTLTRHPMSLGLLADRVQAFGGKNGVWGKQGVVLRNTWYSTAAEFVEWETSPIRRFLVDGCGWLDLRMFCLSDWLQQEMELKVPINMPFDIAGDMALENILWLHIWRFALELFRGESIREWRFIEQPEAVPEMERRTQKIEAYNLAFGLGKRDMTEEEYRDATLLVDRMGLKDDDPFWWFIASQTVHLPTPAQNELLRESIELAKQVKQSDLIKAAAGAILVDRIAHLSYRVFSQDTLAGWIRRNITNAALGWLVLGVMAVCVTAFGGGYLLAQ
ncbi:hypothetical protein HAQ02_02480 [Acidithiobacillus caldus]|nr:hypothetical protein [Acidithiobacillus caldus]